MVNLDSENFLSPYDYNNSAKLTESSYYKNGYMTIIEILFATKWKKCRIVNLGDYTGPDDPGYSIMGKVYNDEETNNLVIDDSIVISA